MAARIDIIEKCMENPTRPVYLLENCTSVVQGDSTTLKNLVIGQPAIISGQYVDMDKLGKYNREKDIPKYIYVDPPPTLSAPIDLGKIEAIENINGKICIYAEKAVISTLDFSWHFHGRMESHREAIQQQNELLREQEKEKSRVEILKKALTSSSTFFKTDLKQFCVQNNIGVTQTRSLVGPKQELEAIANKIREALQERGIDLDHVDKISAADYEYVIEQARTVHEQIEYNKRLDTAREMFKELLPITKPIVEADNLKITVHATDAYNNRIQKTEDLSAVPQNLIAAVCFGGKPLEHEKYKDHNDIATLNYVTVNNVKHLGEEVYAVEIDGITILSCPGYEDCFRKLYSDYLQEHGIEPTPLTGTSGVYYQMQQSIHGENSPLNSMREVAQEVWRYEEKLKKLYEFLAQQEINGVNIYYLPDDNLRVPDDNGFVHSSTMSGLYPGANMIVYHAHDSGTRQCEYNDTVLKVQDFDTFGGINVTVTDQGIFVSRQSHVFDRDIHWHVAEARRSIEQQMQSQGQDTPGNR